MEDLKIASIKLVSGEEIICQLLGMAKDGPYTVVTIKNPAKIEHRDKRKRRSYSLSNWLMINNEGMHDIEVGKIITVNELDDEEILHQYHQFFRRRLNPPKPRASKDIGFVGNVKDFKKTLEHLYKNVDSYDRS